MERKVFLSVEDFKEKTKFNFEMNKEKKEKLEKLYTINKKNPKKINDNLIKLVADKELILSAYEKVQLDKRAMTAGTDDKDIVEGFNKHIVDEISELILKGKYK